MFRRARVPIPLRSVKNMKNSKYMKINFETIKQHHFDALISKMTMKNIHNAEKKLIFLKMSELDT